MTHLNFSRQALRSFSELVQVYQSSSRPLNDELVVLLKRAQVAARLLPEAVKFSLPSGGVLLHDPEVRALAEDIPLRLPFPIIALEYVPEDAGVDRSEGKSEPTRVVLVLRDDPQKDCIQAMTLYTTKLGLGAWMASFPFEVHRRLEMHPTEGYGRSMRYDFLPQNLLPLESPEECSSELYILKHFLNALACSNVRIEKSVAKQPKGNRGEALPFDDYHYLTISTHGAALNGATGTPRDGRSPREHLRRGHIRRIADGRRIWVNSCVVAFGSAGGVEKDYRLMVTQ